MSAIWVSSESCASRVSIYEMTPSSCSTLSCCCIVIQPVWRHGLLIEAFAKQTFLAPSDLKLRRVGHLPVDVLQPRLLRVALESGAALLVLAVEVRLHEPFAVGAGGLAAPVVAGCRATFGLVGATARQDQHGRCCGREWRRYGSSHQFSPVVAPWMGWVGCGGAEGLASEPRTPQGALPGAAGQRDGGDDDESLHGVPPGRRDARGCSAAGTAARARRRPPPPRGPSRDRRRGRRRRGRPR